MDAHYYNGDDNRDELDPHFDGHGEEPEPEPEDDGELSYDEQMRYEDEADARVTR